MLEMAKKNIVGFPVGKFIEGAAHVFRRLQATQIALPIPWQEVLI